MLPPDGDRHLNRESRGTRASSPSLFAARLAGLTLLALVLAPWYRLIGLRATGPSAQQMLRFGGQYFVSQWADLVMAAILLGVLSLLLSRTSALARLPGVARRLLDASTARFGLGAGAVATALSAWVSVAVLNRNPVLMDGVSQLVQARYFAAGRLAGPPLDDPAFWQFQFMVDTGSGWASQYPPGFPALLALVWGSGFAWLVGPLLIGATVALTAFVAERLFPDDRMTARLGTGLMAVSVFLAFHAAAYMNHVLAAALVVVAVFASLRAVEGSWAWALLSGAAVGAAFATRPYVGVVLGFVATVLVWAGGPGHRGFTPREWLARLGAATLGAAPFVGAVMAYNARLFGSVTRFGYVAAAGPAHGLGFHRDPWGSPFGLGEAVGYTAADLLGMSLDLLQTPLPVVVLVGLYLVRTDRFDRGLRLVAAWALLPVAANALYWHHDLFMGPRLLYEAAPGWCLLVAAATVGLVRALPAEGRGLARLCTRQGAVAVLALSLLLAVFVTGPAKLRAFATFARQSGMAVRAPVAPRLTLVFVHEDWESRLGARLSATGMRLDSIRGALAHNSTCEVERFTRAREAAASAAVRSGPPLDFGDGAPRPLREVRMPSGSRIRTYTDEDLGAECAREAASDFGGIVALAPLLWQGDLPGLDAHGAMFVRDLGPERNARLLASFPDRAAVVLRRRGSDPIELIPYEMGMEEGWGERSGPP